MRAFVVLGLVLVPYQAKRLAISLDLNEARGDGVLGCRGISWTICKQSAPRSRQITTPTPRHSISSFLSPNQRCQSTEGKSVNYTTPLLLIDLLTNACDLTAIVRASSVLLPSTWVDALLAWSVWHRSSLFPPLSSCLDRATLDRQRHQAVTSEALMGPGSVLVSRGRRESLEKEECL